MYKMERSNLGLRFNKPLGIICMQMMLKPTGMDETMY